MAVLEDPGNDSEQPRALKSQAQHFSAGRCRCRRQATPFASRTDPSFLTRGSRRQTTGFSRLRKRVSAGSSGRSPERLRQRVMFLCMASPNRTRAFAGQGSPSAGAPARESAGSGWQRFGNPSNSNGLRESFTSESEQSGWHRLGQPPQRPAPRANYGGRTGFGAPATPRYSTSPAPRYSAPATPRYSAPAMPHYNAPRYNAPHYNSPRESAPPRSSRGANGGSRGGGAGSSHGGGGGGHSSGGHRR